MASSSCGSFARWHAESTVLHVITLGSTPAAHMCLKREIAWPGCAGLALAHAEIAELYE